MAEQPVHAHCKHIAGPPFAMGLDATGKPIIQGQPALCCGCGLGFISYLGIVEQGHGPHVSYEMPPKVAFARIELPNGAALR
jgi:hypothetical protein